VIASSHHTPRLHFDRWAMAPLPGVLRTHSLVTSIDCPAASDGDSPAHRLGADRPLRIPSLPCSPPAVLRRLGAPPPAMLIDRWGPGIGREQRQGPASDRLPPLRAHTDDPTSIMSGKGTYSGEIESLECQRAKL